MIAPCGVCSIQDSPWGSPILCIVSIRLTLVFLKLFVSVFLWHIHFFCLIVVMILNVLLCYQYCEGQFLKMLLLEIRKFHALAMPVIGLWHIFQDGIHVFHLMALYMSLLSSGPATPQGTGMLAVQSIANNTVS